jgi:hypothetical protein
VAKPLTSAACYRNINAQIADRLTERNPDMKINIGLYAAIILAVTLCIGCSDDYDHLRSVEQSGDMICIVKERYSAELKVRSPLTRAELFLQGNPYKPKEFPNLVVRKCGAVNETMMSLVADDGVYLWRNEEGEFKLTKLTVTAGRLSNDLKWFVVADKRINLLTGEEIAFKAKLPSDFLGNSPDWKTIITEGQNLVEKDLISLHVVDMETGIAKERFVRRANYMFMLNHAHTIDGIVSDNVWISNQFRWLPDTNGKSQLVYPVLEKEETNK